MNTFRYADPKIVASWRVRVIMETDLVVLVCGGRKYPQNGTVPCVLDDLLIRPDDPMPVAIRVLVEGGGTGADRAASNWASINWVVNNTYQAQWDAHGPAAGPMRNQTMLDTEKPDIVIAFPTPGARNKGTRHMMGIARARGVPVIEVISG